MVEVGASVEVAASLGTASSALAKSSDRLARALDAFQHIPNDQPIVASLTLTAATGIVSCGGPAVGRVWEVRRLMVTGTTGATVWLYASATKPVPGQGQSVADWVKGMPAKGFYSSGQLVLLPLESLWVAVTGGTSGKIITVNGQAKDYDRSAYRTVTTL